MSVFRSMKRKTRLFLLIIISLLYIVNTYGQCNGYQILCEKKYNEVAYLTTHNSYNSVEDGFNFPNQNLNITSQLNSGVRGLMIDVYDVDGVPTVYHVYSSLGSESLLSFLNEIKLFLDHNNNEVVTIILESYTNTNSIENAINLAGLTGYLYTHDLASSSWPTLRAMVNNNTRLVIFSDVNQAIINQGWYHYVWDYAVETHYAVNIMSDFSCNFNRGDSLNDLFILNHFITSGLGLGVESEAVIINSNPYFINRVNQCLLEKNKFPNFVTIDFFEHGDGLSVVNELNQIPLTTNNNLQPVNLLSIYPNPTNGLVTIEGYGQELEIVGVYNMLGQKLAKRVKLVENNEERVTIDMSYLSPGIYYLKTKTTINKVYRK